MIRHYGRKLRNLEKGRDKHNERAISLLQDTRGSFGVKEIALAVAAIVVIGAVVVFLTGDFLTEEVIRPIWIWIWERIQDIFNL